MILRRTLMLRLWLAAILVPLLAASGLARARAGAAEVPGIAPSIPGIVVHICHSEGSEDLPPPSAHHDCCDACALGTAAALPSSPDLSAPVQAVLAAARCTAETSAPPSRRSRTPRQAQGPPLA